MKNATTTATASNKVNISDFEHRKILLFILVILSSLNLDVWLNVRTCY